MLDIFENFCCLIVKGVISNLVTIVNKITVIATIPLLSSLNNPYILSNKIYNKLKIHPKIVANGPKKPPTLVNTNNSNLLFLLNYQKRVVSFLISLS